MQITTLLGHRLTVLKVMGQRAVVLGGCILEMVASMAGVMFRARAKAGHQRVWFVNLEIGNLGIGGRLRREHEQNSQCQRHREGRLRHYAPNGSQVNHGAFRQDSGRSVKPRAMRFPALQPNVIMARRRCCTHATGRRNRMSGRLIMLAAERNGRSRAGLRLPGKRERRWNSPSSEPRDVDQGIRKHRMRRLFRLTQVNAASAARSRVRVRF